MRTTCENAYTRIRTAVSRIPIEQEGYSVGLFCAIKEEHHFRVFRKLEMIEHIRCPFGLARTRTYGVCYKIALL